MLPEVARRPWPVRMLPATGFLLGISRTSSSRQRRKPRSFPQIRPPPEAHPERQHEPPQQTTARHRVHRGCRDVGVRLHDAHDHGDRPGTGPQGGPGNGCGKSSTGCSEPMRPSTARVLRGSTPARSTRAARSTARHTSPSKARQPNRRPDRGLRGAVELSPGGIGRRSSRGQSTCPTPGFPKGIRDQGKYRHRATRQPRRPAPSRPRVDSLYAAWLVPTEAAFPCSSARALTSGFLESGGDSLGNS